MTSMEIMRRRRGQTQQVVRMMSDQAALPVFGKLSVVQIQDLLKLCGGIHRTLS